MPAALAVITIVLVGLMVGLELTVAAVVNPLFDRLPDNAGLVARSNGARLLGRVMPFWYIGSVALGALWAAQAWGLPQAQPATVAAALLMTGLVMSIVLLVPINSRVARWSEGEAPADWRDQLRRWDRFHYARVGVLMGAFVLLVAAGVG